MRLAFPGPSPAIRRALFLPLYLQFGLPFLLQRADRVQGVADVPGVPMDTDGLRVQSRAARLRRVPFGGVYLLAATKQAAAVRPLWRPATRLVPVAAYGKPAFGNSKVIRLDVHRSRLSAGV